jgi:hypothetical protein
MKCPDGIYPVAPEGAAVHQAFCSDGREYMANGCLNSWTRGINNGKMCWRMFPQGGPNHKAIVAKRSENRKVPASASMKEVDQTYVDYEHAARTCKEHGAGFFNNNGTDIGDIMALGPWRLGLAEVFKKGLRAVWVGKVGSIERGVLLADATIVEAPANFRTSVVCKMPPTQAEMRLDVQSCVSGSASSMYSCKNVRQKTPEDSEEAEALNNATKKLRAAVAGGRSFGLAFNQSDPIRLNRMHIQTLPHRGEDESHNLRLSFVDAVNNNASSVNVHFSAGRDTEQILEFPAVSATQVQVTALGKSTPPQIKKVSFVAAVPIPGLIIAKCESSNGASDNGCQRLYDGLSTIWRPKAEGRAWVKFYFEFAETVDRMMFRHDRTRSAETAMLARSSTASASSDAWEESNSVVGSSLGLTVSYDDGKAHNLYVQPDMLGGERDGEGFVAKPITLVIPQKVTKSVKVVVHQSDQLLLSEVKFWNAELLSKLLSGGKPQKLVVRAQHTVRKGTKRANRSRSRFLSHGGKRSRSKSLQLAQEMDLVQGGYCDPACIWNGIKEAALTIAMNLCLAGLTIAQGFLALAKAIVDGIAAVIIYALEALIKMLGPHFFEIMNLMIGGSFDAMQGGKIALDFDIDMWLFNIRIKWGFHVVFTFMDIIKALFGHAKKKIPTRL